MKIWSHLHGDMQRRAKERVERVGSLNMSKVRAKFLVG
jgi:hypothetical protein